MTTRHHAFVIEAEVEEGINVAQAWAEQELGMKIQSNPDVAVLKYGLLSVDDARKIFEVAAGAAFFGESRVIIIAAARAYHEAQNALLKLFEEPPVGTYLFFVLPSLGGLLPTLRSRVQILNVKGVGNPSSDVGLPMSHIPKAAGEFIKASKEKRSAMIKKIATHQEGAAVSAREEAIEILNGIEAIAYQRRGDTSLREGSPRPGVTLLLLDIATLRMHLYDRSAPVKMILEHLSLVLPEGLRGKV